MGMPALIVVVVVVLVVLTVLSLIIFLKRRHKTPSNIVAVIEVVPQVQWPEWLIERINQENRPFRNSLTKLIRGQTYLYTVTGLSAQVNTIVHITRQRRFSQPS